MAETFVTLKTLTDGDTEGGPPPLYVLRVTAGPDSGKTLVLDFHQAPVIRVGQSRASELPLRDPRVSRRHLSLEARGHAVRVRDLDTSNGTKVGGAWILDALLTGGETIEIGQTQIKIMRAGTVTPPAVGPRESFGRLVGRSEIMERTFAVLERLAVSNLHLLVEGETGTGKALAAEAMHDAGPRARRPFMVFSASATEGDEQLEQLFGARDPGAMELASSGTLVIDDVENLSDAAQQRLAPALERGTLRRLDGRGVRVDVRVLATTRSDLEREVQEGRFREELLFRLSGAHVELPPLRARTGDVTLLAHHFWRLFDGPGSIPKSFLVQLERHDWPGNVRELENAVARRIALGDALEASQFVRNEGQADYLEHVLSMNLAMTHARQLVIEEFEQRFVERAIAAHGGNVSRAAAASGVTRRYFHLLRSKRSK